ncbi:MAG: aminoglycoside phosphotransferase family protein [Candidatus Thorarchaeota archaeon]
MSNANPAENEHAIELMKELMEKQIIPESSKIEVYTQVHGGADTTIFEIGFKDHSTRYIQRILRETVPKEAAEFEYANQTILFENGISVPETYFINYPPNSYGRNYYVMKKIEGKGLNEIFLENPEQFDDITNKYIQEMIKIHSIDPNLFPLIPRKDIQKKPYTVIDHALAGVKLKIEKYPDDLAELNQVVNWLDEHKKENPCEELVVIHGDYHPFNIIVDDQQKYQILDWTGINISDFRQDISFATVTLSSAVGQNLAKLFMYKYEQFTGKKVKNLEYFMILSSIWNLMRMYSGLNNPGINNEGEEILQFFKSIQFYPLLLIDLVKEVCGIDLEQIRSYFS